MKFSERWLRTYVDPPLDSDALAHLLTMAGLEVEAVEPVAPPFSGVVVAEVKSVRPHPNADRLRLAEVDVGEGAPLKIVCGAPNVAAGLRVPCARVGATLPGLTIRRASIRGEESSGMLCSARELGLSEDSSGLLVLPEDAPVGMDLRAYLDLDDRLFTLKLTPNRGDCLSVAGIAREVAALTGSPLKLPPMEPVSATCGEALAVTVAAPDRCPRYCGRVIRGVDNRARTPEWMVRRLTRAGLRPINPLVDITNYVLLERGQPMHAFDRTRLGGGVTVRLAEAGERLELLNGQTVDLAPDMLVIADVARPVALAGIMGGAATAVDESTREVFLEAAFFTPEAVAGRARRLGLATDSSYRFERGVDFGATRACLEYATRLVLDICGGEAGPVTEVVGALPARAPIPLRPSRVRRLSGLDLEDEAIAELLRRLGLAVRPSGADRLEVTPPTYRFDLAIEEDLVEEVVRLHGYENLPARLPGAPLSILPLPETRLSEHSLRQRLVERDYHEVVTFGFVDEAWEADLGRGEPVPLRNPISARMGVMRTTLWGGLLDCLRFNLNRKQQRVRLFELGRTFHRAGGGFEQPLRLGGLAFGPAEPEQWGTKARPVDFFDVKGDLESLAGAQASLEFRRAGHPALHPGRSAEILLGGRPIGWLGTLHPRWVQKYELTAAPVLFELLVEPLLERPLPTYREVSRFPMVRRDLAVVVDEKVDAGAMLAACREAAPGQVADVVLFDLYEGKGIDSGKKSLAFRISMQDTRKTLTDPEVDAVMASLMQVLAERFKARLRQ